MPESLQIIEYTPAYRSAFSNLNKEWISKYFVVEETDYKALDHPDTGCCTRSARKKNWMEASRSNYRKGNKTRSKKTLFRK